MILSIEIPRWTYLRATWSVLSHVWLPTLEVCRAGRACLHGDFCPAQTFTRDVGTLLKFGGGGGAHPQSLLPHSRHVARISSRRWPTWRGPKVPPIKNENSSDLAHYILVPGQFIFVFVFSL